MAPLLPPGVSREAGWFAFSFGRFRLDSSPGRCENRCLRQQLLALQRRYPRPGLRNTDRRFWICASRCFAGWRNSLLIIKPETVLRWRRRGWRAYWSWRSNRQHRSSGRPPIPQELQALIRQMAAENRLWGRRRIQAERARLGFRFCARTVGKYMTPRHYRGPSPGWREFLERHESTIWAFRLLLHSNHLVSDALRLFCGPARQ